jgi:hypothetical protein
VAVAAVMPVVAAVQLAAVVAADMPAVERSN